MTLTADHEFKTAWGFCSHLLNKILKILFFIENCNFFAYST